jgi:hypothetical protein
MTDVNFFEDSTKKAHHRKILTDMPSDYTKECTYFDTSVTKDLTRTKLYGRALEDVDGKHVADLKNNLDKLKSLEMRAYFEQLFSTTSMNFSSHGKEMSLHNAMRQEL